MTFPIHPNNYNSLVPAPHQQEESNVFSDGIRRVRLLRSAQLECVTLALVWIDVALVTHQIVLDYALSPGANASDSNRSDWATSHPEFSNHHPALRHQASMALFIAITAMSFLFVLEGIARNIHSRITQKRFFALNVGDAILSGISFGLNISLLIARVSPLARDFVALLIAFRLARTAALVGGLTLFERKLILRMLDNYRREESYHAEHHRMLQTELDNRTKECQDLRELVKTATLARNRLKQKQQLQMKQQEAEEANPMRSGVVSYDVGGAGKDDSGHSSDSSPGSPPREAFGRVPTDPGPVQDAKNDAAPSNAAVVASGGSGPPTDIELTGVAFVTGDSSDEKSVTSRM